MKKYYFLVMALAALMSCSSDEFVGDSGSPNGVNGSDNAAISFNLNVPTVTRADKTGGDAATDLSNQFIVYAEKDETWHIAPDNREGIRISFDLDGKQDSGWFLLRLSVHDPVMPLNAESDVHGGVKKILASLYQFLKMTDGIDIHPVEQALDSLE